MSVLIRYWKDCIARSKSIDKPGCQCQPGSGITRLLFQSTAARTSVGARFLSELDFFNNPLTILNLQNGNTNNMDIYVFTAAQNACIQVDNLDWAYWNWGLCNDLFFQY